MLPLVVPVTLLKVGAAQLLLQKSGYGEGLLVTLLPSLEADAELGGAVVLILFHLHALAQLRNVEGSGEKNGHYRLVPVAQLVLDRNALGLTVRLGIGARGDRNVARVNFAAE